MLKSITITICFLLQLYACKEHETFVKKKQPAAKHADEKLVDDSPSPAREVFPYELSTPDKTFLLPKKLNEISGIAAINDSLIACIEDENGIIFFYNLNSEKIESQLKFTGKGDFEDVTLLNETLYVLNSNGTIWSVKDFSQNDPQISSTKLPIDPPFELEGLCVKDKNLLVAAKYYHNKKRDSKGLLPVWEILLPGIQLTLPVFSLPDIQQDPSGAQVPFHTSALWYDEKLQQYFALSTHTKFFLICDLQGNILQKEFLSAQIYTQPEGLCITPSGNMLISNEGRDGKASILLFTPKKEEK